MNRSLVLTFFCLIMPMAGFSKNAQQIENSQWRGIYNSLKQVNCKNPKKCTEREIIFVNAKFTQLKDTLIRANTTPSNLQGQINATAEQIAMYGIRQAEDLLQKRIQQLKTLKGKKAVFLNKKRDNKFL